MTEQTCLSDVHLTNFLEYRTCTGVFVDKYGIMKRLVHQRETPEQMQNVRCFLHQCSSSNNQSIGGLLASSVPSLLIYNIQVPLHTLSESFQSVL